jgi:8-oxo-dGTP diphosphatase
MKRSTWIALGRVCYWISWPGLRYYLRWSNRTRVVVISNDRLLVVKGWLSNGGWSLPGGGLHHGEPVTVGACRELYEETGLQVYASDLTVLSQQQYRSHGLRFRYTLIRATSSNIVRQTLRPQPIEILELAWLTKAELVAQRVEPDVMEALRIWVT